MKYIVGEKPIGCFFCDSVAENDDRGNLILHRGSRCFIIMNRYPYNNGHVMVAPMRHVANLEELDRDESLEMMTLLQTSIVTLRNLLNPEGFNVGINMGEIAGAGVADHIHMHVVPRWGGDTNFMPVLSETKVINEELEETYDTLLSTFSK